MPRYKSPWAGNDFEHGFLFSLSSRRLWRSGTTTINLWIKSNAHLHTNMPCPKCSELSGKLTSEHGPHADLVHVKSENCNSLSAGWAKGSIDQYECTACGATMTADRDKKDEFASWSIAG